MRVEADTRLEGKECGGGGPGNAEPRGQRTRTKEVGPGLILGDGVAWKGWAGAEAEVKGG